MVPRQRIISFYQRKKVDRIPWGAYCLPPSSFDLDDSFLPRGETERKLREKGCALISLMPICKAKVTKVEVLKKTIWQNGEEAFLRIYRTPLGEVHEKIKIEPGYKSPWIKEYLIKELKDYKIAKFVVENTVFEENYEDFLESEENVGEDGLTIAYLNPLERSPLQMLLTKFAGVERTLLDLYDHPDLIEDFMDCLEKKEGEILEIARTSPAKAVLFDENITSDITSPKLFSKYCLPFYKKYIPLLHKEGKICLTHLDGKLNSLKNLIKNTDFDVIDSFTLPEAGGDLALEEARKSWSDKAITINFPAFLCLKEEKEVEKYLKNLLQNEATKNDFMIEISEDLPHKFWKKPLLVLAKVLEEHDRGSL